MVPLQTGPDGFAEIVTVGTRFGVTVIVTVFEVAVAGEAQVAFEVIMTRTTSPLFSDVEEKLAPVPAFVPFICH